MFHRYKLPFRQVGPPVRQAEYPSEQERKYPPNYIQ